MVVVALGISLVACGSPDSPVTSSSLTTTTPTATDVEVGTTLSPPVTATTTTTTTSTPEIAAQVVIVPPSEPPTIDGVVAPSEWAEAASVSMSDGASAQFMYADEVLYVAVAGDAVGSVNVVIANDSQISILHSSAALGSAVYERDGSVWNLVHGFDWCCRRGSDESAREALLNEEAWEANIGHTGDPGVVEYAVAIPWQDTSLAISSVRNEADKGFWPADVSSEAQDQLLGVPPQERVYNIEEWGTIIAG